MGHNPDTDFRPSSGQRPTALFTGANHSDEYEGPIALQWLAYNLRTEDVSGRVIIIPYMNNLPSTRQSGFRQWKPLLYRIR